MPTTLVEVGNERSVSSAASPRTPVHKVGQVVTRLTPTSYFLTSAVFHYLGPSLAVLLFVHVQVLGVAWLRIASALSSSPSGAGLGGCCET